MVVTYSLLNLTQPEGNLGLTCVQPNLYTILQVRTGKPTTIGQHISGLVQVGLTVLVGFASPVNGRSWIRGHWLSVALPLYRLSTEGKREENRTNQKTSCAQTVLTHRNLSINSPIAKMVQ